MYIIRGGHCVLEGYEEEDSASSSAITSAPVLPLAVAYRESHTVAFPNEPI